MQIKSSLEWQAGERFVEHKLLCQDARNFKLGSRSIHNEAVWHPKIIIVRKKLVTKVLFDTKKAATNSDHYRAVEFCAATANVVKIASRYPPNSNSQRMTHSQQPVCWIANKANTVDAFELNSRPPVDDSLHKQAKSASLFHSSIRVGMLCWLSHRRKSIYIRDLQPDGDKKEFAEFIETFKRKQQTLAVMSRHLLGKQTLSHLEALNALSRWQKLSN